MHSPASSSMSRRIHEYFNRRPAQWCILGFLNECDMEPFERKMDEYLKSLSNIIDCEQGIRHERAKCLLDRYRKVKKNGGVTGTSSVPVIQDSSSSHKTDVGAQVTSSVA
ncbi:hypothetical protein BC936DRAFT_139020 [Jimgerdemannia flammicorona]|uniref:Uncharacterized protein n=1 Tax=Jimgerdemannia flammicorona TaxID=994334 RepID=A0A433BAU6_9FUNG|nr:hypothetical protein BC936DRAFT_139020 [Jimgerdemannia flammicorona]